mmetsp:Transcript_73859/g.209192  ORF Transcript_73859/g.209192 Transcript_73859/m.209192 type:complete len:247 (+) Transcript_73859:177-917(+)
MTSRKWSAQRRAKRRREKRKANSQKRREAREREGAAAREAASSSDTADRLRAPEQRDEARSRQPAGEAGTPRVPQEERMPCPAPRVPSARRAPTGNAAWEIRRAVDQRRRTGECRVQRCATPRHHTRAPASSRPTAASRAKHPGAPRRPAGQRSTLTSPGRGSRARASGGRTRGRSNAGTPAAQRADRPRTPETSHAGQREGPRQDQHTRGRSATHSRSQAGAHAGQRKQAWKTPGPRARRTGAPA